MCHGSIAMWKNTSRQNAVQRIQNWHGAIRGNAWQNEKAASSDSTLQRGLCTTGDHSRTETSSLRLGSPPQDAAAPLRDLSRAHIEILRATQETRGPSLRRGSDIFDIITRRHFFWLNVPPLNCSANFFSKKVTCSQPIYGKLKNSSGYTRQYIRLFGLVRVGAFPRKFHGVYQQNCVGN